MQYNMLYTMYLNYVIFSLSCGYGYVSAFIPNNLENILTRKAVISNIFNNVRSEVSIERMFIEFSAIMPYHHQQSDYMFIPVLTTYLFGQYKYLTGKKEQYAKLKKIEKYKHIYNMYRSITIIFIFMFLKDVDSVY